MFEKLHCLTFVVDTLFALNFDILSSEKKLLYKIRIILKSDVSCRLLQFL